MTTASSVSSTGATAHAPAMSYAKVAQAGKDRATPQAAPQNASKSGPPSLASVGRDDVASTIATSGTAPSCASEANDSGPTAPPQLDPSTQKRDPATVSASAEEFEASAGSHQDTPRTISRDDAASVPTDAEKGATRTPISAPRTADDSAFKKGRKGKKGKSAERDGEAAMPREQDMEKEKELEAVKVELADAPIPSVNPWMLRKELHSSKAKPTAPALTSGPAPDAAKASASSGGSVDDMGRSLSAGSTNGLASGPPDPSSLPTSGKAPQGKPSQGPRPNGELPRRSGPRGNRSAETNELQVPKEALPPVEDATLWPTPQTAATSESHKPKGAETSSQTERDGAGETGDSKPRPKGKQWVAIPFTPSAVFQTPLPARGSKTRGRGGGRDSGSTRGGHPSVSGASPAEKPGSAAGPPRGGYGEQRDRPSREGNGAPRGSLQTANSSKRGPTDASFGRDRRPSAAPSVSGSRDVGTDHGFPTSRGDVSAKNRVELTNGDGQYSATRSHPTPSFGDRQSSEHLGGGNAHPFREQAQHARGTSRRGRGAFAQHSGLPTHSAFQQYPVAVPSNGPRLGANQAVSPHHMYSPPPPAQFGFTVPPQLVNGRHSFRSSVQLPSYGGHQSTANGARPVRQASAPLVSTPGAFQGYLDPQPLSAFPTATERVGSIPQIIEQVDYYFSRDNLLHDEFLRKRMDNQGFVPLEVVARFHRLRSLSPDLNHTRLACESSLNLEFVVSYSVEAGDVELIRARNHWQEFVLPMEDRQPEARSHGPDLKRVFHRSIWARGVTQAMMSTFSQYQVASPTTFQGATFSPTADDSFRDNWIDRSYASPSHPMLNGGGVNGHAAAREHQLSAAVPDFSPIAPNLSQYQNWSDEDVSNHVVGMGPQSAHASNGANGQMPGNSSTSEGWSNGLSHGSAGHALNAAPITSPPPTSISEAGEKLRYSDLRGRAFKQRTGAAPGETPSDMKALYEFWRSCLSKFFNVQMYEDFRSCAVGDAKGQVSNTYGLNVLLNFYNEILSNEILPEWRQGKPYPTLLVHHQADAIQLQMSLGPAASPFGGV